MSNVVDFGTRTPIGDGLAVPTEAVLAGASSADLRSVVVVGVCADGALFLAGSDSTAQSAFLMQRGIAFLVAHNVERT